MTIDPSTQALHRHRRGRKVSRGASRAARLTPEPVGYRIVSGHTWRVRAPRDYHAPVHCVEHHVDLAALRRYVSDGKPCSSQATLDVIRSGECPACRPRYMAAWAEAPVEPAATPDLGETVTVVCRCCRTAWEASAKGWVATVDGGLSIDRARRPIRSGAVIDSESFVVDPFDPRGGPEEALRGEFSAFDAASGQPAADDLVEDVSESMLAAARGKADLEAELARIVTEHRLGPELAGAWSAEAHSAYAVVEDLLSHRSRRSSRCRRCSDPHAGVTVSRAHFEELVRYGLDSIPPDLASRMENVAVVVEDESSDHLLGLYQGVNLTRRGWYAGATPDRITIYQETMSKHCDSEAELAEQVRRTTIHEVAHHFGIGDPELRHLGW